MELETVVVETVGPEIASESHTRRAEEAVDEVVEVAVAHVAWEGLGVVAVVAVVSL
jgi:hypothetical protein